MLTLSCSQCGHSAEIIGKNEMLKQPTQSKITTLGIHDKNGTEIFVGDLIKVSYEYTEKGKPFIAEVRFKECQFYPHWLDKKCEFNDSGRVHFPECEVIGNVFEHPSLLNSKDV